MIYVYDFVFVMVFLFMKDFVMYLLSTEFYNKVIPYYLWFEFSFVCLCIYFIPTHSIQQGTVAFFMCLCLKGIHDIIKFKKFKKNK